MDVPAHVHSRGRITIPHAVREALAVAEGDTVLFRVEGERVVISRIPNLMELGGSVSVPAQKRGTPWDDVLRQTWRMRAEKIAKPRP